MEIIPAVDIKGGKVVRLYQGNFSKETTFSENPLNTALKWQAEGASRLHIIDLDGAAKGQLQNLPIIKKIVKAVNIPVQLGGGIRKLETVAELLAEGTDRVILGTAAVEDEELVVKACQKFGEAVVVSLDARDGFISTYGWQKVSAVTALELGQRLEKIGVKRIIYTDISRDGTLSEPNFEMIAKLVASIKLPLIASGGISSLEHLRQLKELGVEGAIIGKALYTGDLKLKEVILAIAAK